MAGHKLLSEAEAVFFDLDGTLFDAEALALYAFRNALHDLAADHDLQFKELTDGQLLGTIGAPGPEQARMMLPEEHHGLAPELHRRVQHYEQEYIESGRGALFPGVTELLEQLRNQDFRTFLASNCSLRYRDLVCGHVGLLPLLDKAYCIEMFPGQRKVDMVRAAVAERRVSNALMVGDRSSDIEAGIGNDLPTVACHYGFGDPGELAAADFAVQSVAELRVLLARRTLALVDVARLVRRAAEPSLGRGEHFVVGITGPDAAGKTTFARELAELLQAPRERRGAPVHTVVVHGDDFHRPLAERRSTDLSAPEAYYQRTFDWARLVNEVLEPVHAGARELNWVPYDIEREAHGAPWSVGLDGPTIVLVEGVFLLCEEARALLDFAVLLESRPDTILTRVVERDGYLFGAEHAIRARYLAKYLPGQQLYEQEVRPEKRADLVIDHNDPGWPRLRLG